MSPLPLALTPQTAQPPNTAVLSALAQISAAGVAAQYDKAEQYLIRGKAAGLSELQMYEAVLNLVPYTGYPRTLNTMSRFQKVYPQYLQSQYCSALVMQRRH